MTEAKMIKTLYLKATPQTVWDYLTQSEKLARWFHETDTNLDTVGVDYQFLRENPGEKERKMCWGQVLEADRPNKLVYTFTHQFLKEIVTTVCWELEALHGGTQLTMTHTGFDAIPDGPFDQLSGHDKGWDSHFARLRTVASTF